MCHFNESITLKVRNLSLLKIIFLLIVSLKQLIKNFKDNTHNFSSWNLQIM